MSIIDNIVGRIHVSTPLPEVIRQVQSALRAGVWDALPPRDQVRFISEVRLAWSKNVRLYNHVMNRGV